MTGRPPAGTESTKRKSAGSGPPGRGPAGSEPAGAPPAGVLAARENTEPARADETEPDARFTFANERTFLAWSRTALALVVAGLAIVQLLPPFPGLPWGRHLLAVPLIVLGAVLSVAGFVEWGRNQRALRRGEPLPRSRLPGVLSTAVAVVAVVATVLVLWSAALR